MASISQASRLLRSSQLSKYITRRGFRTGGHNAAARNFNMPAMSPTMMEGGISHWSVKEGDKFKAGQVLLEIETDKAHIDVEAPDDGIMAKIFAQDGTKGIKVGTRIAVIAEPDDNLATLELPPEPKAASPTPPAPAEEKSDKQVATPPSSAPGSDPAAQAASHKSVIPKPNHRPPPKEVHTPSPSVASLLKLHNLTKEDLAKIQGTGPQGRVLKGDVLAFVGKISKDAPGIVESRIEELAHLDLSNIKVRQVPKREEAVAGKEEAPPRKQQPAPTQLVELSHQVILDNLESLQKEIQTQYGFIPPVSAFLREASRLAHHDLPKSKVPPSSEELFNELLSLPKRASSKPTYTATLKTVPVPIPAKSTSFLGSSSKKTDIIDILSGPAPKVKKPTSVPDSNAMKMNAIVSVKVRAEDEARGRQFLKAVADSITHNPKALFASWNQSAEAQGWL